MGSHERRALDSARKEAIIATISTTTAAQIAVAHDQTAGWSDLLSSLRGLAGIRLVHAQLGDAHLPRYLPNRIDVLLLAMELGDRQGHEAMARLVASSRPARTIMVVSENTADLAVQSARLGALGQLSVAEEPERIAKAIHCVRSGETWYGRRTEARLLASLGARGAARDSGAAHTPHPPLSKRERDVVALLGSGLKNREIAERLSISDVTVRHHLTSIFHKVGVSNRHALVLYFYRSDLLQTAATLPSEPVASAPAPFALAGEAPNGRVAARGSDHRESAPGRICGEAQ
jgi:two-component system nitrate/nitrite response regulator NarL